MGVGTSALSSAFIARTRSLARDGDLLLVDGVQADSHGDPRLQSSTRRRHAVRRA